MHLIRIHCRDSVLLYLCVCSNEGQCPMFAALDDIKKINEEATVHTLEHMWEAS